MTFPASPLLTLRHQLRSFYFKGTVFPVHEGFSLCARVTPNPGDGNQEQHQTREGHALLCACRSP